MEILSRETNKEDPSSKDHLKNEPSGGWTEALGEAASNPEHPRSSGDQLYALGKFWTVASCEARLMAQFEQWVRRSAKSLIAMAEEEDGPEEANKLRSTYMQDYGAGCYTWEGRHCRAARSYIRGLKYLLYLGIKRCHPDVTTETVDEMFEESPKDCGATLAWMLGNPTLRHKESATKK